MKEESQKGKSACLGPMEVITSFPFCVPVSSESPCKVPHGNALKLYPEKDPVVTASQLSLQLQPPPD